MKRVLLFFVRWPEPGAVKSRIAASIGDEEAARLYQVIAEDQMESLRAGVRDGVYTMWIYGTPVERLGRLVYWLNEGKTPVIDALPQPGGSLADRLEHALERGFGALGADQVFFAGSDCPALSANHVSEAAGLLERNDAVMGRARDGGFYLLGLGKKFAGVFRGVEYSSHSTADELATALRALGASLDDSSLPVLNDVDELEDVKTMPREIIERLRDRALLKQIRIDSLENL